MVGSSGVSCRGGWRGDEVRGGEGGEGREG